MIRSSLLQSPHREKIVAVVDLKSGLAVHAVAGDRQAYQPISIGGQTAGDPFSLVSHYRDLGIGSLYLADLDSLLLGRPQIELLDRIVSELDNIDEILIDIGLPEADAMAPFLTFARDHKNVFVIAATECAKNADSLRRFEGLFNFSQIMLGMDYRNGNFLGGDDSEETWLLFAEELGIKHVVALDTATVGTLRGPTIAEICSRIRGYYPGVKLYSGGGIRDASDVKLLLDAGCDCCLVATALLEL